jgi:hypothetical protein
MSMIPRTVRATAAALATCVILLAACGDDILAPPDGTACTVGTIAPGDSVESALTSESCAVWSDYNYVATVAESWTLNAKAHTAYVVRVYHLADPDAFDNWNGDVWLYARNAAGDAEWAGGWWGDFGPTNGNSEYHKELIFTTPVDRTVSIRVEADEPADTGFYAITVESCPAPALTPGVVSAGVNVTAGCLTKSMLGSGVDGRAAFWTFEGDTANTTAVNFNLTDGNGHYRGWVTGEGLDYACWSSWCTYADPGTSNATLNAAPTIDLNGDYSATAVVNADSAATVTVQVVHTPITAPRFPFTGPARAGRNR